MLASSGMVHEDSARSLFTNAGAVHRRPGFRLPRSLPVLARLSGEIPPRRGAACPADPRRLPECSLRAADLGGRRFPPRREIAWAPADGAPTAANEKKERKRLAQAPILKDAPIHANETQENETQAHEIHTSEIRPEVADPHRGHREQDLPSSR